MIKSQNNSNKTKKKTTNNLLNTNITMENDMFPNFSWRAFKGSVNALNVIKIPKEYIIVGAESKHIISIFSLFGKIHWLYNLEFPLPNQWHLSVSSYEK